MINTSKFEIYTNRKGGVSGNVFLIAAFSLCALIMIKYGGGYPRILIAVMILLGFLCSVAVVLSTISDFRWRIKVSETEIKVQPGRGKCYSFKVSDITKVSCGYRRNYRAGYYPVIEIKTVNRKLEIPCGKIGFEQFAQYLLENYENGTIMKSAVSETTKKELLEFRG